MPGRRRVPCLRGICFIRGRSLCLPLSESVCRRSRLLRKPGRRKGGSLPIVHKFISIYTKYRLPAALNGSVSVRGGVLYAGRGLPILRVFARIQTKFRRQTIKVQSKAVVLSGLDGGARSGFTPELCGSRRRAKGTLCASPSVYGANSGSGGLQSSGTGRRGYVDEISHKPPYINAVSVADPVSDIFAGITGQMATAYNRKSVHIGIFERTIDRYRNEMKTGMPKKR